MKVIKKILNIYCLILIPALLITGISNLKSPHGWMLALFLTPIFGYFVIGFGEKLPIIKKLFLTNMPQKLKKILVFLGFFFSLVVLIAEIREIKQAKDLVFVLMFLPLTLKFFALFWQTLGELIQKLQEKRKLLVLTEVPKSEEEAQEDSRRKFLKILAGTGIGVILVYLLNPKKVGGAFFGSIPGPGTIAVKDTAGAKIDPAIKSPIDGYGISEVDDDAYPNYYGFVNKDDAWYILKEASDNSFRYTKGTSDFATNWTNRASVSLSYDYFNVTF